MNWDVHGGNIRHESAWKIFSSVENWKMQFFFHEICQQVTSSFHWRENDLQSAYRLSPNSGQAFDSNVRGMIEFIVNPFSFLCLPLGPGDNGIPSSTRKRNSTWHSSWCFNATVFQSSTWFIFLDSVIELNLSWKHIFRISPQAGSGATKKTFSRLHTSRQTDRTRSHTRRTLSGMDYGTIKTIKASG